jgi:hypothetical protein
MDAKSLMEQVQAALDVYERSLGFLHINTVDEAEINNYFTMTRDQIDNLSPLDTNEIAIRLNQFAFFIQKQYNVEQSRLSWCESEINKYSADKLNDVGGQYCKFETKLYLIAKQDEFLNKLLSIRNYAKERLDRLTYLSSSIKNLADTFLSCSKIKITLREKN